MLIVRLGEGVDATGPVRSEAALERTFAACREYAELLAPPAAHRCASSRPPPPATWPTGTTSSPACARILGVTPEVISGARGGGAVVHRRHARSARRTRAALPRRRHRRRVHRVRPRRSDHPAGADQRGHRLRAADRAAPALAIRPTPAQIAAATADIDAAIARAGSGRGPRARRATLVGVAGTVTTVAAIALDLPAYDAQVIHHSRHPARPDVRRVSAELLAMDRAPAGRDCRSCTRAGST